MSDLPPPPSQWKGKMLRLANFWGRHLRLRHCIRRFKRKWSLLQGWNFEQPNLEYLLWVSEKKNIENLEDGTGLSCSTLSWHISLSVGIYGIPWQNSILFHFLLLKILPLANILKRKTKANDLILWKLENERQWESRKPKFLTLHRFLIHAHFINTVHFGQGYLLSNQSFSAPIHNHTR